MKKFFKKIKNIIKNNKFLIILAVLTFIIFAYTHFNTFLGNDDLPYSFFYRGPERITNIIQVVKNQVADYSTINGRVIVHSIMQVVLIFGKNLWSILNPLMIIASILFMIGISSKYNKKINKPILFMIGLITFLILNEYKSIIYWVAGSTNYVWTFAILAFVLMLYYKYGLNKNPIINFGIIFILTALQESTMVFTIIFVLANIIYDWIKTKKFNKKNLIYLLALSGSLVLLLSPANQARLTVDEAWSQMNIIEKLMTSIPVVSLNLMDLLDYKNIIAYIFIICVSINLFDKKDKKTWIILSLIILNIISIYIFKINWLYFSLILLLVLGEYYGNIKKKRLDLCILSLSFYAVAFFNILTPIYYAGRPNYFFYMYVALFAMIVLSDILKNKKVKTKYLYVVLIIISTILLGREVYIYTNIGMVHRERLEQITEYKKNNQEGILVLKKMPKKFASYHMDCNLPYEGYFTYPHFLNYYGLNKDTKVEFK